jgi:LacI family transcriptional regulator
MAAGMKDVASQAGAAVGPVVPLTAIRQPKCELGQTAAQLILEEADAPAEHEHRRFVFTPEPITRASQPGPARPVPES